jgi:hypothetical protein
MIAAILAALLIAAPEGAARVNRLPPVDRCASDSSFVTFRGQLRGAIARRDATALLSMVSSDISYSFGDEPGREGFVRAWGLERPAQSDVWRQLGAVMALGCDRDGNGALWAPSMSLPDPDAPDDASYEGNVLALPGAVLRAEASDRAPVIARLEWDVLMLTRDDHPESAWAHAGLADNRQGYVLRSQLRSFTGYRAVFEKRRGRWLMTAFVIGD